MEDNRHTGSKVVLVGAEVSEDLGMRDDEQGVPRILFGALTLDPEGKVVDIQQVLLSVP